MPVFWGCETHRRQKKLRWTCGRFSPVHSCRIANGSARLALGWEIGKLVTDLSRIEMRFVCPHCFKDYDAPETAAGCAMTCAACNKGFVIPSAVTPVVVPYSADPPLQPPLQPLPQSTAKPSSRPDDGERKRSRKQQEREDAYLAEMEMSQFRRKKNRRAMWSLLFKLWLLTMLIIATVFTVNLACERKRSFDQQEKTRGKW